VEGATLQRRGSHDYSAIPTTSNHENCGLVYDDTLNCFVSTFVLAPATHGSHVVTSDYSIALLSETELSHPAFEFLLALDGCP
jgi:hypothetical protein